MRFSQEMAAFLDFYAKRSHFKQKTQNEIFESQKSEKNTTYPLIVFWDKKNFVLRMGHVWLILKVSKRVIKRSKNWASIYYGFREKRKNVSKNRKFWKFSNGHISAP